MRIIESFFSPPMVFNKYLCSVVLPAHPRLSRAVSPPSAVGEGSLGMALDCVFDIPHHVSQLDP